VGGGHLTFAVRVSTAIPVLQASGHEDIKGFPAFERDMANMQISNGLHDQCCPVPRYPERHEVNYSKDIHRLYFMEQVRLWVSTYLSSKGLSTNSTYILMVVG
jgi:hypothetical protein